MPATQESGARTRAFARVIRPWLVIVAGVIVLRASEMDALASEFFKSGLFEWFAGALLPSRARVCGRAAVSAPCRLAYVVAAFR